MGLKVVTIPRGGTLPSNMMADKMTIRVVSNLTLLPGETIPETALKEDYQVTVVEEDPPPAPTPQAYLIVPCERGKGSHRHGEVTDMLFCTRYSEEATHQQIPCPLTLGDLLLLDRFLGRSTVPSDELDATTRRIADTVRAWAAVPQPKEAGQ